MRQLKIVIADGHRLMIHALRFVLDDDPGLEVVGESCDGAEVLPLVGRTDPDVVLLDLRMPRVDGLDLPRPPAGAVPVGPRRDPLRRR